MFVFFLISALVMVQSAAEENTTLRIEEEPDVFEEKLLKVTVANLTVTSSEEATNKTNDNKTIIEMQRITQPSQTQQIERHVQPTGLGNYSTKSSKSQSTLTNFKPSPHLETFYEFNKIPVPPAFPEAKHSSGIFSEEFSFFGKAQKPWVERPLLTTEQPWVSRIKFPSPQVNERPYNFINNEKVPPQKWASGPTNIDGFAFNKPVETPGESHRNPPIYGSVSTGSFNKQSVDVPEKTYINQFFGGGSSTVPINNGLDLSVWEQFSKRRPPAGLQKTQFDYNLMEKPAVGNLHKTYDSGLAEGHGGSPWKKIIKLLTAFIPIGLLISALTPTVITVSSANQTRTRSRAEDSKQEITKRLISSINYFNQLNENGCEDRILCELLLSASNSKNAEQHVANLLNNFSEQEKNLKEKADDLRKVFDAVRSQDCRSVLCKNTMNPT